MYNEKIANITNWQEETNRRIEKGIGFFMQGYNCTQSVALTFADLYDIPEGLMARISASFGGGIGRMRETCGTASGMFMMAGLEEATEEANQEVKARNYAVVQQLAASFREQTGTLICRDLLKNKIPDVNTNPTPDARTAEYYKKRPCAKLVGLSIGIYMKFLQEKYNSESK